MQLVPLALASVAALSPGAPTVGEIGSWSDTYDRHAVVHHDVSADGTLWARGRGYKASADAWGFTFIPFLGSDAPRNHPVRFELVGVTRGGDGHALNKAAAVEREGDRIVLDRGMVRVRYDLTPDGVEQLFEIDAMPGTGDLRLSLDVETDLMVAEQDEGFRFSNELGGALYGAAIVFDAAGQVNEVTARWSGGGIQLVVPASFLDGAEWPIVVDPLITPFAIGTSAATLRQPDAAHDGSDNRYCVVFEEQFSAADVDVFLWYVSPSGVATDGAYVDQSSSSWTRPRVVQHTGRRESFIVAEADSVAIPGSVDVTSRIRRPDGTFASPLILQSATSSFSCAAPDVGADGYDMNPSPYLVAYNRVNSGERDLYWTATSGAQVGAHQPLATGAAHDTSAPSVSSLTGTTVIPNWWTIAWSQRELATGASSVQAAQLGFGTPSVRGPFVVAPPTTNALYFDVSASTSSTVTAASTGEPFYLITYDDRLSSTTDALVAVCSNTTVHGTHELQVLEHADRAPNQNQVRVSTAFDRFMIGYEENGELHVTTVQPVRNSLGVVERRTVAVGSDLAPGSLVATDRGFHSSGSDQGLFVWSQPGPNSPGIFGTIVSMPTVLNQAAGNQYCYGTPNSTGDRGFIQVFGDRTVGGAHTLRVETLPPNVFGYFLASETTGNVVNAGGSQGTLCLGGSIGRFGVFQTDANGVTTQALDTLQIGQPTGPVAAFTFDWWHFQSWYRDAVGGTATSNFTNAVRLPFR